MLMGVSTGCRWRLPLMFGLGREQAYQSEEAEEQAWVADGCHCCWW